MSSLFDDSFLADLEPTQNGGAPPPPPEPAGPEEEVPHDLFAGSFAGHGSRDAYYRDGAPRPVVDPRRCSRP